MEYEFDYNLRRYEACIRQYQKCLEHIRDSMRRCYESRVIYKKIDHNYHWSFNNALVWNGLAKGWYEQAMHHKARVISYYQYDTQAVKQYG